MRVVLVVEDDDFDQFVEEEEVIYVNDGLQMSRDQDGYFYENEEYKYIMVKPPMANPKKDLAKIDRCKRKLAPPLQRVSFLGGRYL